MASSSRRSTRAAAAAADAAAAAVAIERAGGLARGLRRSRPGAGAIVVLHVLVRVVVLHVPLLHACAYLGTWYLLGDCSDDPYCRASVLKGHIIGACRDDSSSLGFSSPSFEYCSLSRRSSS